MTGVAQGDTVSIQWSVNDVSSSSPSWQSYTNNTGITVIGAGTESSTLTIPGEPVLNETIVTCLALGDVNEEFYGNTTNDTLYIQGRDEVLS